MAEHRKDDIKEQVENFHNQMTPMDREASYDLCYGYFQTHRHHLAENMELSCLHLWSYLASWGMLRGSSVLLNDCSMKVLSGIVEYLDTLTEEDWMTDVPDYREEEVRKKVVKVYEEISKRIETIDVTATVTLVTKIMMGTIGNVPAIDDYLARAFREEFKDNMPLYAFRRLNAQTLECFYEFYSANKPDFDALRYPVIDFDEKRIKGLYYKNAKLIDMYGWSKGEK